MAGVGDEMLFTWIGCKRNDLISISSGQLLSEDDVCLLSGNGHRISSEALVWAYRRTNLLCPYNQIFPFPLRLGPSLKVSNSSPEPMADEPRKCIKEAVLITRALRPSWALERAGRRSFVK
jgi:hypothetical protein